MIRREIHLMSLWGQKLLCWHGTSQQYLANSLFEPASFDDPRSFNPSEIFQENMVSTIVADTLAPCVPRTSAAMILTMHDDVIIWKHFPRYWPFVRGIHRSPSKFPYKGQWRGALMFSLTCVWINGWVNNREAGDFKCHYAHYDVIVMV